MTLIENLKRHTKPVVVILAAIVAAVAMAGLVGTASAAFKPKAGCPVQTPLTRAVPGHPAWTAGSDHLVLQSPSLLYPVTYTGCNQYINADLWNTGDTPVANMIVVVPSGPQSFYPPYRTIRFEDSLLLCTGRLGQRLLSCPLANPRTGEVFVLQPHQDVQMQIQFAPAAGWGGYVRMYINIGKPAYTHSKTIKVKVVTAA